MVFHLFRSIKDYALEILNPSTSVKYESFQVHIQAISGTGIPGHTGYIWNRNTGTEHQMNQPLLESILCNEFKVFI